MDRVRSHDQGFVAAGPSRVYGMLANLESYPSWWPGSGKRGDALSLPLLRRAAPARTERERNGVGVHLVFGDGSLEWYLEPFDDGTIVNAFLDLTASAGKSRRLLRMRARVRDGLVGLKRRLEAPG
ncbi:MAG: hypothetical protein ACRDH9_05945 [Actinomycetota bacterium]